MQTYVFGGPERPQALAKLWVGGGSGVAGATKQLSGVRALDLAGEFAAVSLTLSPGPGTSRS